jgi:chemotaxis-related protein WspB
MSAAAAAQAGDAGRRSARTQGAAPGTSPRKLFLLFQLGRDHYALDSSQVVEVLPFLEVKKIPQAPRGVAGVFNYRGAPVPAIDLSDLALGQSASTRLGTRIILVNYQTAGGASRLLGLIAEKATQTLRCAEEEFVESGLGAGEAPYLGPVIAQPRGLVQRVEVNALLPEAVRALLFPQPVKPHGDG